MNHITKQHREPSTPNISSGHYRLSEGVHVRRQNDEYFALCDYPLRVTKLPSTVAKLLTLCEEEHTCEELSTVLGLPVARVEALCDQLHEKSLLDAGPPQLVEAYLHVSIVIPSYNRARELERCIRSLLTLNYPLNLLEIVVVDDASTDDTLQILCSLTSELAFQQITLRVIQHEQQRGVAVARNSGTQAANHEVIAYIDSDCVASPDWLSALIPYMQDERIAMVGGEIRAYDCTATIGRYEDICSSLYMGSRLQRVRHEGPLTYLPTANLLIRKSAWQHLHGFKSLSQGEDVDFCRRLLATGKHIFYVPQGTVYHDYRKDVKAFLGIRAAYATAEASLLKLHPDERRVLLLPPEQASFAGLIISALWSLLRPRTSATAHIVAVMSLFLALTHMLTGTKRRQRKLQQQGIFFISAHSVFIATLRGHLAYTYHLCRHLTRYYTLPLLLIGLLIPPLLPVAIVLCGIVIGVNYVRLKPDIHIGWYALYSLLEDCAYEWGVVKGCVKERMWKPLWPVIKRQV